MKSIFPSLLAIIKPFGTLFIEASRRACSSFNSCVLSPIILSTLDFSLWSSSSKALASSSRLNIALLESSKYLFLSSSWVALSFRVLSLCSNNLCIVFLTVTSIPTLNKPTEFSSSFFKLVELQYTSTTAPDLVCNLGSKLEYKFEPKISSLS